MLGIAALALWRHRITLAEVTGTIGGILFVAGLAAPSILTIPNRLWWKFALTLGWINMRILLSVLFIAVLSPIGLWWRITGNDPLARRRKNWPGWATRPDRFKDHQHFTKRF